MEPAPAPSIEAMIEACMKRFDAMQAWEKSVVQVASARLEGEGVSPGLAQMLRKVWESHCRE